MRLRVAVEDSLRAVKERLRAAGYDVLSLAGGVPDHVAAVVVNGLDDNLLGRQDVLARAPVINAAGLTPEEVAAEVARRLGTLARRG
jgi:coenzyme F420-reducing hydrogenase alpha subunit